MRMAAPIRTSISVKPTSEPGRERAPGVRRRRRPFQLGGVRLDSGMTCQTPGVLRHSDAAALAKGVAAAHWASSADGASGDRAADGRPGEDDSLLVGRELAGEPCGGRLRADEHHHASAKAKSRPKKRIAKTALSRWARAPASATGPLCPSKSARNAEAHGHAGVWHDPALHHCRRTESTRC